jgi:hypothetical protein
MVEILHKKSTQRRKLNFRDKLLADKIRWYRRDRDFYPGRTGRKINGKFNLCIISGEI